MRLATAAIGLGLLRLSVINRWPCIGRVPGGFGAVGWAVLLWQGSRGFRWLAAASLGASSGSFSVGWAVEGLDSCNWRRLWRQIGLLCEARFVIEWAEACAVG